MLEDTSFYDYFNLSDAEMSKDHERDTRLLPPCNNDFTKIQRVNGKREFEDFINTQLIKGQNHLHLSL